MYNFTTVLSQTVAVILDATTLIDPTTLIGGVVTVAIVGSLMVKLVRRLRTLAR